MILLVDLTDDDLFELDRLGLPIAEASVYWDKNLELRYFFLSSALSKEDEAYYALKYKAIASEDEIKSFIGRYSPVLPWAK